MSLFKIITEIINTFRKKIENTNNFRPSTLLEGFVAIVIQLTDSVYAQCTFTATDSS